MTCTIFCAIKISSDNTFLISLLLCIIVAHNTYIFILGTPKGIDFNEVKDSLCAIKGVRELHNLRIWSLTLEKAAVSVHLAVGKRSY